MKTLFFGILLTLCVVAKGQDKQPKPSAVDRWTPPPMVGNGWCRDGQGKYDTINPIPEVSQGLATAKKCYEICKSKSGCTAFAFRKTSKKCNLYKGGPYTSTSSNKRHQDATCYKMKFRRAL